MYAFECTVFIIIFFLTENIVLDKATVATRLRNRRIRIARSGHVRVSNDFVGFCQLFNTRRTQSEKKNVRQEPTAVYVNRLRDINRFLL